MRRQIPSSVPLIFGLWFVAIRSLNVGVNDSQFAYRSRAFTRSPPVSLFTSASDRYFPCSVSTALTNRLPTSFAMSAGIVSVCFTRSVFGGVLSAYCLRR